MISFAAIAGAATLAAGGHAPCTLQVSGPVTVASDGQVVEWLNITTTDTSPGIHVTGKKNVVIQNVVISHAAQTTWPFGNGIYFSNSPNLTISNVEVNLVGYDSGPLPDLHNYNIFGMKSTGARISNVRVSGGSSGIELSEGSHGGVVSNFVAKNVRGPYPRGQCFQASESDNIVLQDFYCLNDNSSWTEDSVSIWRSSNATVRRGLVDGSNSPSGVGVMIEQDDLSKSDGLVEDIDAIRMGDGCFSAYGGKNIRFVRTRCRENHCSGWSNRSAPMSGGLLYAAGDENGVESSNLQIEDSQYFDVCGGVDKLTWEAHPGAWIKKDLTEVDFTLRTPQVVNFCWDGPSGAIVV